LSLFFYLQDVVRAAFGRSGFVMLTIMQFLYPFIGKYVGLHTYQYFVLRRDLNACRLRGIGKWKHLTEACSDAIK